MYQQGHIPGGAGRGGRGGPGGAGGGAGRGRPPRGRVHQGLNPCLDPLLDWVDNKKAAAGAGVRGRYVTSHPLSTHLLMPL